MNDWTKQVRDKFKVSGTGPLIRSGPVDSWLLGVVLLLVLSGEILVFNTTYFYASDRYDDPYVFVWKHNIALGLGILGSFIVVALPSTVYRKLAYPILLVAVGSLLLVLLYDVGPGRVHRWISFGSFNFQPSELAKGAVVLYGASALTKKAGRIDSFVDGLLPPLLVVGSVAVLIGLEPDMGGAVFVCLLFAALIFVAGARVRHLAFLSGLGIFCLAMGIFSAGYRAERFFAFLNQSSDLRGAGYQLHQSLLAFGAGGVNGVGLGESRQKMFYLPEAHTDFVFAVVGEETGLWGTTAIVVLFGLLGLRGISIAVHHPTSFGRLLAFGVTFLIVCQAGLNMAVAVGLLPTTGLPMPFVSYGGSAMVMFLVYVGLLLGLSREVHRRNMVDA